MILSLITHAVAVVFGGVFSFLFFRANPAKAAVANTVATDASKVISTAVQAVTK